MRVPLSLLCTLWALAPAFSGAWMGIKPRPRPAASESAPAAKHAAARPAADTTLLYRRVIHIPAKSEGLYLGNLEGVRCFNCEPDQVLLNLGDSVSSRAAVLSMRIEAWNAVERPLKDRRMYDYGNKCFYFGFKEIDTAFVGGEWTEIRVQDVPCYPYVRRTLAGTGSGTAFRPIPKPAAPAASPAMASAPAAPEPASPAEQAPVDVVQEPTID